MRESWTTRGPFCEGWPIHDLIVDSSGMLFAADGSLWYGQAVLRSADFGETWTHSSAGLACPEGSTPIKMMLRLAKGPDDALRVGVPPAGLFRSHDEGATFEHVEALTNHPTREPWQPASAA